MNILQNLKKLKKKMTLLLLMIFTHGKSIGMNQVILILIITVHYLKFLNIDGIYL